jgi:hypothetical protein
VRAVWRGATVAGVVAIRGSPSDAPCRACELQAMANRASRSCAGAARPLDSLRRDNFRDWTKTRETYGPHTEHYIQAYANPIADRTLLRVKDGPFPAGAVIAKQKLLNSPQGTVAGVAFMIKRGTANFARTGGWEFTYDPRARDSTRTDACATCHESAATKDSVFGQYPSSGDPLHPAHTNSQ